MKILVDSLQERPEAHRFEVKPSWWSKQAAPSEPGAVLLDEPLVMAFDAHAEGEDLILEGILEGSVDAECGRCLARYRHALRETFRLVLEPAGDRVPAEPESARALAADGMCLGDEFETGWYRGSEIELERFVAEFVALSLPVQPACREDCAGLCPLCGVDRNTTTCACSESKVDSPFAVLATLRKPARRGD